MNGEYVNLGKVRLIALQILLDSLNWYRNSSPIHNKLVDDIDVPINNESCYVLEFDTFKQYNILNSLAYMNHSNRERKISSKGIFKKFLELRHILTTVSSAIEGVKMQVSPVDIFTILHEFKRIFNLEYHSKLLDNMNFLSPYICIYNIEQINGIYQNHIFASSAHATVDAREYIKLLESIEPVEETYDYRKDFRTLMIQAQEIADR